MIKKVSGNMGRIHSKETRKKRSESLKKYYRTHKYPSCGFQKDKKLSEKHRRNISISLIGHPTSKETRRKIGLANSISLIGNTPWNKGLTKETDNRVREHSIKQKLTIKNLWSDSKYRKKQIKAILNSGRPTCYERKILEIIQNHNLPYKYTGNGSFLIGYKNPDFIHINKRICIEVFYDYFKKMDFGSVEKYEDKRRKHFNRFGWDVIFINNNQLDNENRIVRILGD